MAVSDTINRVWREFRRYTGDGLPGEPAAAPLPFGDPSSGAHHPKKSEIRTAFTEMLDQIEAILNDATQLGTPANGTITEAKLAASLGGALPRIVADIVAMKALTVTAPVLVRSYFADGLGGGGLFYPDAADTTTADNGGTVIVRTDGMRMKRAGYNLREINVADWGCSPDLADNTTRYNAIIAAAPDGAKIVWPKRSGVWRGHFVAPAGRTFKLDGQGNTASETDNTKALFRMDGTAAIVTTLTANATYGQKTLTVASGAGLAAAGDQIIMLEDDKVRPGDSLKVNQELLRTTGVVGTTVTIEDMVRSMQDSGTRNVHLLTPIDEPEVRNWNIHIINPYNGTIGHAIDAIFINYARRPLVENIEVDNHYAAAVSLRYCYEPRMIRARARDPINIAPGGYGPSLYVARRALVEDVQTWGCRNVCDMHAVYDADVTRPRCSRGKLWPQGYGVAIGHNRYSGAIRVRGARLFDLSAGYGVFNGNQSIASPQDYVLRDMLVEDVEVSFANPASTSNQVAVYVQTSYANLKVQRATLAGFSDESAPALGNAVVRVDGVCYGASTLEDLHAPRAGCALFNDLVGVVGVTTGIDLLRVAKAHVDVGQYVAYTRGCKHIASEWLTAGSLTGTVKNVASLHNITQTTNDSVGTHSVLT